MREFYTFQENQLARISQIMESILKRRKKIAKTSIFDNLFFLSTIITLSIIIHWCVLWIDRAYRILLLALINHLYLLIIEFAPLLYVSRQRRVKSFNNVNACFPYYSHLTHLFVAVYKHRRYFAYEARISIKNLLNAQ